MALPALELLSQSGFALTLAGRPWAKDLFSAYPWTVAPLPGSRIQALRQIGIKTGLLLTNSFSSALEFKLAGISAIGYGRDGRSWLLRRAIKVNTGDHMVEYYFRIAAAFSGAAPDIPRDLRLRIDAAARGRAEQLIAANGVQAPYVVLCPVAVGFHRGKIKAWNGFTRLCFDLVSTGTQVVALPGPSETGAVRNALPGAAVLPESDVATFAAVLAGARLVVANDSGPGHVAAAVGARLISVFGVTEPEKTRPWSTRATLIGSSFGWPAYADVRSAVDAALRD
ncbi:MAG TPA: glycosyltransferase family 9 protein [Burkholderiaceae bacterium]|nr:glycosyltransferase family 9 protein [Burkholderiaceae bacterium]